MSGIAGFANWLSGGIGRIAPGQSRSLTDIDKILGELCRPQDKLRPSQEKKAHPRIPDDKVAYISVVLKHFEAIKKVQGWHKRPRIYAVLREIGRLDVMNVFVSTELTDSCIPFQ